ncbi:MAG: hypothetical protein ACQEXJ_13935 [Myxococcota bacterium]
MRRRLSIARGTTLLALCLFAAPAAGQVGPEDSGFDPDVPGGDDVEPEPSRGDDVEPSISPEDDVEPSRDVEPAEEGRETPDEEVERRQQPTEEETLPPDGLAERPMLPRIGIDVMYPRRGVVGQGAAVASINEVGEDVFVYFNLGTVFVGRNWAIAPRLPIRLRIVDGDPETDAVIREEDWDEPSDWARLLAFFQWGHVGDPYYVRYGELNGVTVGHGTLINRYYNTVDIDRYQGGVYSFLDPGLVGGEVMIDNLFDPEVMAARPFVRPLDAFGALPFALQKLKLGATFAVDRAAPLRVRTDEEGEILIDEDFEPRVAETDFVPMLGLDLEVPVVSRPHFDMVPYVDFNTVDMEGSGVHAGSYFVARFDTLKEWRTRLEYRYSGAGYQADYVNPFYEIHRVRYRADKSKLAWLRDETLHEGKNGFYMETEFRWVGLMRYTVVYSNDEGPDNTDLVMKLRFPQLGPMRLSAFFARLDFDGADDFFDPQDTVLAVSARYNIGDLFFIKARLVNEWWMRHTDSGSSAFETTTDYDLGFGLLLKF